MSKQFKIIGLTGFAGSGKDAFAKFLVATGNFVRIGFADAVKEMALVLDPKIFTGSRSTGPEPYSYLSTIVMADGWDKAKQIPEVREYLQILGTEAGRNILGNDVWVNAAKLKADEAISKGFNVVITDVRFPNEEHYIKSEGGILIRIVRENVGAVNDHISDVGIDSLNPDVYVHNDGSLEDLKAKASEFYGDSKD